MKMILGFVLAFAIGVICRLVRIPSPAPNAVLGSLLVVAMSVGYVLTDKCLSAHTTSASQSCSSPEMDRTRGKPGK
jgi:XapX domain-containing protein